MLLHTNFIAESVAARRRHRRLARAGAWATLVAGVLLLLPPLVIFDSTARMATRLLSVREERGQLVDTAGEAARLAGEIERLGPARRLAVGAHANNAGWLALLRELRDLLPEGMWYTRLAIDPAVRPAGQAARQVLVIEGRAERFAAIGEFLTALQGSPHFAGAALVQSGPSDQDKLPIAYRLEAVLRRPIAELATEAPAP